MKKVICPANSCQGRRVHHEQPDIPRGPQYIEVPDDCPDNMPVFCSMTCALEFGYITLKYSTDYCPYCLTAGIKVTHSDKYKCWRAEDPKK